MVGDKLLCRLQFYSRVYSWTKTRLYEAIYIIKNKELTNSKDKIVTTDGGKLQNKYFIFICESCELQMQLNNKELAKSRAIEHRNSGHIAYWTIERENIW